MKRKMLTRGIALAIIATGSVTLARPTHAATMVRDCTIGQIIGAIDALCPNGGKASDIEQVPGDGCWVTITCSAS